MSKRIHMLCNAHIDPVWQWEWEEGAASAVSTFRAAADFCEEFDDFVECHCEGGPSNAYYCIDGYSLDETDGSCCIFLVDYHGPDTDDNIIAKNIEVAFNKIRRFVEKSIKAELYREIRNQ